ncbi:DUF1013 domain-containing protein [Oceanicella sp. SM1341]|uniref:DUF1013 domain-containing protein n=1 Tax=Oceanicella sp. SM1341 TaxID=1548889 RepID=UPI000E4F0436|nr:cell cycle transcriptional regulator TrcR [Oceanicella sp. SM1341]
MTLPLMPKATAVWLVENTTLTFAQIADFCGLHELEVNGIADGEVAQGMKGFDPIVNNQLTAKEIERVESDPSARLKLKFNPAAEGEMKRKGPRYTPLSKRQDRPAAIAWLVKFHPELADSQIAKLVGTTKPTIQTIRDRTHWNIANIQPVDPVALGMCRQVELDSAVQKAAAKKAAAQETTMTAEERMRLLATSQSLHMEPDPRLPSSVSGFENFSLGDGSDPRGEEEDEDDNRSTLVDADSFFNLPKGGKDDDEDEQP